MMDEVSSASTGAAGGVDFTIQELGTFRGRSAEISSSSRVYEAKRVLLEFIREGREDRGTVEEAR